MQKTAKQKIELWLQTPENLESRAWTLTYAVIAQELNIAVSSVSINLPIIVASRFKKNITWFNERRKIYRNRRADVVSEKQLETLKWLRRKKRASLLECAYELGLHYQTVRKYCKLLKC